MLAKPVVHLSTLHSADRLKAQCQNLCNSCDTAGGIHRGNVLQELLDGPSGRL